MKRLLITLALLSPIPVSAQALPPGVANCASTLEPGTCAGIVLGAAVCYDRRHPWKSPNTSSYAAAHLLARMGIHSDYLRTAASRSAAQQFIYSNCPR